MGTYKVFKAISPDVLSVTVAEEVVEEAGEGEGGEGDEGVALVVGIVLLIWLVTNLENLLHWVIGCLRGR